MLGLTSIWTNIAAIVIGCVTLLGIGVLFQRSTAIERRSLVATVTLMVNFLALYMLVTDAHDFPMRAVPTAIASAVMSVLGLLIGRAIDDNLNARQESSRRRDPGTYGGDLAD